MTTKEQERKALEKIRKIVDDLGENSYLATAFDGAFELAEQNIEDDAAYSARYYMDTLHETRNSLTAAEIKATEQQAKIEHISAKVFTNDDFRMSYNLARMAREQAQEEANKAAAAIVENASDPTGSAFITARDTHRVQMETIAAIDAYIEHLDYYRG